MHARLLCNPDLHSDLPYALRPSAEGAASQGVTSACEARSAAAPGAHLTTRGTRTSGSEQHARQPSAREGRCIKEHLRSVSLQEYSAQLHQRGTGGTLARRERLWVGIDSSKVMCRAPPHALRRVNKELPAWEQWRSMYLEPPPLFQSAHVTGRVG